ncbi:SIMPL domain-containing protein [Nocardia flavorosea]|uniref:SIMPL domain-containing protein n=1 Tax=Nocardia flavorosea TaxID=53429 RepID=A0A846YKW0_9NOCA|nr:SIMPL domain-containing protein [Nocardia flavorosea]NKY59767.1 SIMPL domain-containing protein [Nocardia flavorosea]
MDHPQTGTVTVFGQGTVHAVPDLIVVGIGVECRASTVGLAYEQAGRRLTAITTALREDEVPGRDIATGVLSVRSDIAWQDGVSRITGYIATGGLRITLSQPGSGTTGTDPAGVIAHAVAAGGDDARLGGLQHAFADRTRLLTRARDAAWDDALDRARHYARRAARDLGPVLEITEDTTAPAPRAPQESGAVRMVAATSQSSVPVEPGEQEISTVLRVTWQLG